MKIGLTQCKTESNEDNRRKQIISKFKKNNGLELRVIFYLMKNAVDTTTHRQVEKRVRENIGIPVNKAYAMSVKLPVHTEWVLTTQDYVRKLRQYIKEEKQVQSIDLKILKTSNFGKFELTKQHYKDFLEIIKAICKPEDISKYIK